ncbi:MAG: ParA family protein [Planctomycetota bacterium]|jgi:hypothetical protein
MKTRQKKYKVCLLEAKNTAERHSHIKDHLYRLEGVGDVVWVLLAYGVKTYGKNYARRATEIIVSLSRELRFFAKTIEFQIFISYSEIDDLSRAKWQLAEDLLDADIPLSSEAQDLLFADRSGLSCEIAEKLEKVLWHKNPSELPLIREEVPWLLPLIDDLFPGLLSSSDPKFKRASLDIDGLAEPKIYKYSGNTNKSMPVSKFEALDSIGIPLDKCSDQATSQDDSRNKRTNSTRVLAIVSQKGGCGKTTVCQRTC